MSSSSLSDDGDASSFDLYSSLNQTLKYCVFSPVFLFSFALMRWRPAISMMTTSCPAVSPRCDSWVFPFLNISTSFLTKALLISPLPASSGLVSLASCLRLISSQGKYLQAVLFTNIAPPPYLGLLSGIGLHSFSGKGFVRFRCLLSSFENFNEALQHLRLSLA